MYVVSCKPFTCCITFAHQVYEGGCGSIRRLKKCIFETQITRFNACFWQHFTKNSLYFYDKILVIIRSIPPTFPVLMPLPEVYKSLAIEEKKEDVWLFPQRLQKMKISNIICAVWCIPFAYQRRVPALVSTRWYLRGDVLPQKVKWILKLNTSDLVSKTCVPAVA